VPNFYPVGWPQLEAIYTYGYAYARSLQFYNTTLFWQWMCMHGDIVFAIGALLMARDFITRWRNMVAPPIRASVSRTDICIGSGDRHWAHPIVAGHEIPGVAAPTPWDPSVTDEHRYIGAQEQFVGFAAE
jgi:hypothetical protein